MLPLDSSKWAELRDAHGTAERIPALLAELSDFPVDDGQSEPWISLWSALAHQGDVYPASFAAVPHVVEALAKAPQSATASYFQFPAWVEICRGKTKAEVPADLAPAYAAALAGLPALVGAAARHNWSEGTLQSALAAVAAAQGQYTTAEAILELTPDVAAQFLEWVYQQ
jgi:hypothetical protein